MALWAETRCDQIPKSLVRQDVPALWPGSGKLALWRQLAGQGLRAPCATENVA